MPDTDKNRIPEPNDHVELAPDFSASPLWINGANTALDDLPITGNLRDDLSEFSRLYESVMDILQGNLMRSPRVENSRLWQLYDEDPRGSKLWDEVNTCGKTLSSKLQEELGLPQVVYQNRS